MPVQHDKPKSHRFIMWIGLSAAVLFIAAGLTRLRLSNDIVDVLPKDDPVVADYQKLIDKFNLLDSVYIEVSLGSGDSASWTSLTHAARAVVDSLHRSGQWRQIIGRIEGKAAADTLGVLIDGRAGLLDDVAMRRIEQRLVPSKISDRLHLAYRQLLNPSGAVMLDTIRRDPLGIDDLVLSRFQNLSPTNSQVQFVDGWMTTASRGRILIIGLPLFAATDTAHTPALLSAIDSAGRAAEAVVTEHDVFVRHVSGHRTTFDNAQIIRADMARLLPVTCIVVAIWTAWLLRRVKLVIVAFIPTVVGTLVALGLFGWIVPSTSALVLGCGAAWIGITIDFGIHTVLRWATAEGSEQSQLQWARPLRLPMMIGGVTTAAAMLCLLTAQLPGQRQIGLFGAIGVLATTLFTVIVLPAWLPKHRANTHLANLSLIRCCSVVSNWIAMHRRVIGVAAICLAAGAVAGIGRLQFDAELDHLVAMRHSTREDERAIQNCWGVTGYTYALVTASTTEQALKANDDLAASLARLKDRGVIQRYESVSAILPSEETQRQRHAKWQAFWSSRIGDLRSNLHVNEKRIGFRSGTFDPFINSINRTFQPIRLQSYANNPVYGALQRQIVRDASGTFVLTRLVAGDSADSIPLSELLRRDMDPQPPGTTINVFSKRSLVRHIVATIRREAKRLGLLALAAVTVCVVLSYGRLEPALIALAPVIVSLPVTLGVLGWIDEPINLFSALFVVFVVGLGIDYSAFLVGSRIGIYLGRGDDTAQTLAAMAVCLLTSMTGFIMLVFADHPALHSIGVAASVGLVSNFVAVVLLVPTLADVFLPRNDIVPGPSLKHIGGGMYGYSYLLIMGLIYWFLCWPMRLILWDGRGDRFANFARKWAHYTGSGVFKTFPYRHSRLRHCGVDPSDIRPGVIVANHLAAADVMCMLSLPWPIVMIVKRWVWRTPIMGRVIRDARYILTADTTKPQEMLTQAAAHIAAGRFVVVFPEGTRSRDGAIQRFHSGAFHLAQQSKADLIPVVLTRTNDCTPRGRLSIGDFDIRVRVMQPIPPDAVADDRPIHQAKRVREIMKQQVQQDWQRGGDDPTLQEKLCGLYRYTGPLTEHYVKYKWRLDPVYRGLRKLLPIEGRIIDAGCGHGLLCSTLALQTNQYEILGVDRDVHKLKIARHTTRFLNNVRYENADLRRWAPLATDAFLMIDVLHYWRPETQRELIHKFAANLNNEGRLVLREASRTQSWTHRLVHLGEVFSTGVGQNIRGDGLYFLHIEQYIAWCREAGLSLIERRPDLGVGSNELITARRG